MHMMEKKSHCYLWNTLASLIKGLYYGIDSGGKKKKKKLVLVNLSQNSRLAWVGREHKSHFIPPPAMDTFNSPGCPVKHLPPSPHQGSALHLREIRHQLLVIRKSFPRKLGKLQSKCVWHDLPIKCLLRSAERS